MYHRITSCLLLIALASLSSSKIEGRTDDIQHIPTHPLLPKKVLLFDVDNTLYEEAQCGLEYQIAQNIHRFVEKYDFGTISIPPEPYTSPQQWADALHAQYGSTIHGLVQWHGSHKDASWSVQHLQEVFYQTVYRDLDYSRLLLTAENTFQQQQQRKDTSVLSTGYGHVATPVALGENPPMSVAPAFPWRKLLQSIASSSVALQLASNSPRHHVEKVLQALGLCRIPFSDLYTPNRQHSGDWHISKEEEKKDDDEENLYPTKYQPRAFFRSAAFVQEKKHPSEAASVFLIDDSRNVVQAMERDFAKEQIQPLHLTHHELPMPSLLHAIATAMEWIDFHFTLDESRYLQAKNQVDATSIHTETFQRMLQELLANVPTSSSKDITVVDVGAGNLFMLRLLLSRGASMLQSAGRHLRYYAYEPNVALLPSCIEHLEALGFVPQEPPNTTTTPSVDRPYIFHRTASDNNPMPVTVHLCMCDYRSIPDTADGLWKPSNVPDLIVGCCFADLIAPMELISSLMRCFLQPRSSSFSADDPLLEHAYNPSSSSPVATDSYHDDVMDHTLLFFPITFTGITSVDPSQAFAATSIAEQCDSTGPRPNWHRRTIPSDTMAFHYYAQALKDVHDHHLSVDDLVSTVEDYGGKLLQKGPSDWIIDPEQHSYLWNCMMYFFGTVAAPSLQADGWDARGWLHRLRQQRPVLRASNVDLLFRIPPLGHWKWSPPKETRSFHDKQAHMPSTTTYQEILFTGPRQVTCRNKETPTELLPDQVRIQSEYSLISSGTELNIFRGNFDTDAVLDTTIAAFSDTGLAYPLAYGYSCVGRVVQCGSHVAEQEWIGQRVFTFAAHASQVITDVSQVQVVPDDIAAMDAIFLPAMETAVSLVQDARPMLGENVAIFGQGLIGLLVTALLQDHVCGAPSVRASLGEFGTLTTWDVNPTRRAVSAALGSSQALDPRVHKQAAGPFDVIIEVSGNAQALQMALDTARRGGRIIVGSWYGGGGSNPISLQLGLEFHRSHITVRASQVSELSADLRMTWNKARRFALTWAMVRRIRPSRLITRLTTLEQAECAYRALEEGTEVAVAFDYNTSAAASSSNEPPSTDSGHLLFSGK